MANKIALLATPFLFSLLTGTASRSFAQDSLPPPPLHTLKAKNIDQITPSFETEILTIKMKSGVVYTYQPEDWDFEDHYSSLDQKLLAAIRSMQKTWTKVEQQAQFPGGQEAWDKYIKDFCQRHKMVIENDGPADIIVQFIVHLKGQVVDIRVISNPSNSDLAKFAIQAIKDSPPWIPAVQNGRKVVSYTAEMVKFAL